MAIGTAALLGSAGIGAAANLIGNIFGKKSSDNANATNMKIAQMNNEWSEKMMQKQMDYNTAQWQREAAFSKQQAADANAFTKEMWNASNEYNSAQNQAARLLAAGLNPALAMSGNNAGTAQGASGAQAATPSGNSIGLPSPSGATMQAFRPDFSGIGAAADSFASNMLQKDLQGAQIKLLDKQIQWYDAKAQQELNELEQRTDNWRLKNKYQDIQNSWANDSFGSDVYKKIREGWNQEASARLHIKNAVLTDKQIMRFDEHMNAVVADLVASEALKKITGKATDEQIKSTIEDVVGKKLSNREKRAIFDYVVEKARIDSYPSNPFQGGYDLGKSAWEVVKHKWNNTDWKNLPYRGYPKPW